MHPGLVLGAMALFQLWPWVVFPIGGDSVVYQLYMECFSRTLAEGVLRPSWCRFVNQGFGSSVFFFYFPLPYYIAHVFMPLKSLGFTTGDVFVLQIALANMAFAASCYWWVRKHTSDVAAMCITMLVMFVPYRMELMFYRAAHAETWVIALLPLWMMATERLIKQPGQWPLLAFLAGITALMHTHMALIFGIISFSYAAFLSRRWQSAAAVVVAGVVGVLLAAYFLFPTAYYKQFILGADDGVSYDVAAVNRYPMLADFYALRARLVILSIISLFGVLCLWVMLRRRDISAEGRAQIRVWLAVFAVSALLYSPLIAPLFDNSLFVRSIFFPWRMQVVFIPLFAVLLLHGWHSRNPSLAPIKWGDAVILVVFLNLLQLFSVQLELPDQEAKETAIMENLVMRSNEYTSITTPKQVTAKDMAQLPPPSVVQGEGQIQRVDAYGDAVVIDLRASGAVSLSLPQQYFPSWHASSADAAGNQLTSLPVIRPNPLNGSLFIDVPAGVSRVLLENKIYAHAPWWVRISPYISLLTLIGLLLWWWRDKCMRRADRA